MANRKVYEVVRIVGIANQNLWFPVPGGQFETKKAAEDFRQDMVGTLTALHSAVVVNPLPDGRAIALGSFLEILASWGITEVQMGLREIELRESSLINVAQTIPPAVH